MPIPLNTRTTLMQLEDATGALKVVLGPGPGDGSLPEMAEGGKQTTNIIAEGDFQGRIYGAVLEGEVSVTIMLRDGEQTADEVWNAVHKINSWVNATTCDPGGQVWAPSLLFKGTSPTGATWALRWPSCRPRVTVSRSMEGCSIAFTASVVGDPLRGAAALAWPS